MSGRAVLSTPAGDLEVLWENEQFDERASILVPKKHEGSWRAALGVIRRSAEPGHPVCPYPTLPIGVPLEALTRSSTGFYAVASLIWGPRVHWKTSPPYPKFPSAPAGAVN